MNQQTVIEEIKGDVNAKKYEAEVLIPAEAEKKADELKAVGKASYMKEQGIAMADAVKEMKTEWQNGESKELYMLHLLPNIVDNVSKVISDNLKVDKLVMVGGNSIPSHVGDITSSVVSFLEQINGATGIDLTKIINGKKAPLPVGKELE